MEFLYDGQGRRLAKTVTRRDAPGSPVATFYVWDGWTVVEEIESARDAETGVWAETVVAEYLPGLGLDDHIVAFLHGEEIHFHQDHLGSVLMLTDADGNVLQRYRYDIHGNATVLDANGQPATGNQLDPNGQPATGNQPPLSPYLFTGRRLDRETGLYYYRNRYYSPLLGKFISPDPLDYVDGMNVYAYVNGNVVNLVDPMGLAGYFFDGTCNHQHYYNQDGSRNIITNVRRLYKCYSGEKFYVPGIGSGFNADGKWTEGLGKVTHESATGSSMKERAQYMLGRLEKQLSKNDKVVDLIGFSRGSATSSYFLNLVQAKIDSGDPLYSGIQIRFVALFDQVPSKLGVPRTVGSTALNLAVSLPSFGYFGYSPYDGKRTERAGEFSFVLPKGMKFANMPLHLVSLDEQRREFPVTNLEGAYQIGFRGVHANIGGGYENDFLAYITFRYVYEAGISKGVPFDARLCALMFPSEMRDLYDRYARINGFIGPLPGLDNETGLNFSTTPTDNSMFKWDDNEERELPRIMVLHQSVGWFTSQPENPIKR